MINTLSASLRRWRCYPAEGLFTTLQPLFEVFHPAQLVAIGIIDDKFHDALFLMICCLLSKSA